MAGKFCICPQAAFLSPICRQKVARAGGGKKTLVERAAALGIVPPWGVTEVRFLCIQHEKSFQRRKPGKSKCGAKTLGFGRIGLVGGRSTGGGEGSGTLRRSSDSLAKRRIFRGEGGLGPVRCSLMMMASRRVHPSKRKCASVILPQPGAWPIVKTFRMTLMLRGEG